MRTTQTAAMLAQRVLEGSASDFNFQDEDDSYEDDSWYDDEYDDDELDQADFSGSGDGGEDTPPPPIHPVTFESPTSVSTATSEPTRGGLGPSVKVRKVC